MKEDVSSKRLLSLAQRAMKHPESLTHAEIQSLAGSVLTQAANRKVSKKTARARPQS